MVFGEIMGIINSNIAIKGLNVSLLQFAVSADNVARRNVTGSEKNRVIQMDSKTDGVEATVDKVTFAEQSVEPDFSRELDSSNIDYAEEMIHQIVAETSFYSNLGILKTSQKMEGTLLDIKL